MENLDQVKERLRAFAEKRDWDQFHSPKNLSMALSVEVAELVECFQWLTEEQSQNLDTGALNEVADEIADIQLYLVRLADKLNIDIMDAVNNKLVKNEEKYPADRVRGSSQKYSDYPSKDEQPK